MKISYSRQTGEGSILSFVARGDRKNVVWNGVLPFSTVLKRAKRVGGRGFSFEWLQRKERDQGMLP
jgi:hypothetical protein